MADRPILHTRTDKRRNALVAASQVVTSRSVRGKPSKSPDLAGWQTEAWDHYDNVGELRFGISWISNAWTRVNLVAASAPSQPGDDPAAINPEDDELTRVQARAVELTEQIAGGPVGQGQVLGQFGKLLPLQGWAWLVAEPAADDAQGSNGYVMWKVYAQDQVRVQREGTSDVYQVQEMPGDGVGHDGRRTVHEFALVVKCWRPHARFQWQPDSQVRGVLTVLELIDLFTRHMIATGRSRLAGAGILAIPSETSFAESHHTADEGDDDGDDRDDFDLFVDNLTDMMTTPIRDRDNASAVVPLVVQVPGEYVDKLNHISFSTPFDERVESLLTQAVQRLALGLDIPPEVLTGMADVNHWCQSDDTEILTRRGWLNQTELVIGDEAFTLNHETGAAEWQPVTDIYRAPVEAEPMHSLRSGAHSSLSTGAHRWPIVKSGPKVTGSRRRWTTSDEGFAAADRVPVAANLSGGSSEQKWSDDFVRLAVAYTSDGTRQAHGDIRIVKFAEREIVEMRRVLTGLFGASGFREHPHTHTTSSVDGVAFVFRQSEASSLLDLCDDDTNALPLGFVDELTEAQLKLMLDSCLAIGAYAVSYAVRDGERDAVRDGDATVMYQVEPDRLDAFAYAAHLSGHKVTYGVRNERTGHSGRPWSWVRWTTARDAFAPSSCETEIVEYTGTVWCPVTANSTWFARRDGHCYFTGNTAWQVEDTAITLHIEPGVEVVCDALTDGYLRDALKQEGYSDEDVASVMVWYDTTALTAPPDLSANVVQAWDRFAASNATLRTHLGLSEDDQPDDDELQRRLLIALATANPQAGASMLRAVGLLPDGTPEPPAVEQAPAVGPPSDSDAEEVAPDGPPDDSGSPDGMAASAWMDALVAASDGICFRALEVAGRRLHSKLGRSVNGGPQRVDGSDPATLHTRYDPTVYADLDQLLAGAFDRVPELAADLGVDPDAWSSCLNGYLRGMLAGQNPHERFRLVTALGADALV